MSVFDDMCAQSLATAEDVFGSQDFTIEGLHYSGIHNEFAGDDEVEIGGELVIVNATLVCQLPQFRAIAKPVHKTLCGKIVVIDSLRYRVAHAASDTISVTLGLIIQP